MLRKSADNKDLLGNFLPIILLNTEFKNLEVGGFRLIFSGWIAVMNNGICSVVKVNSHPSEPFSITCLVHQSYLLSSLLYVLALVPLLWNLELLKLKWRGQDLHMRTVSSSWYQTSKVEMVISVAKEYELAIRAKINADKLVGGVASGRLERQIDTV